MVDRFGRDLVRGSLELVVLSTLAEGPQYGYLIQKRIREASSGRIGLQAGTLYPLLHRLEASRWVRSRWGNEPGRPRKWYELTAAGRRQLHEQAHEWSRFADCLRKLVDPILNATPRGAAKSPEATT